MNYSIFQFSLIAKDKIRLPYYKGSAFRGLFGHALRKTVCVTNMTSCELCLLHHHCVYAYMFETFNSRNERVAHPFVLEPPLLERRLFPPGDSLKVNLVLFGKALEYIPFIVLTFKEMGKRGIGAGQGKFWLKEVTCGEQVIYDFQTQTVTTNFSPMQLSLEPNNGLDINHVILHFITPTALKINGKITPDINFVSLLKAIVRRIKALSVYHNGHTVPEIDIDVAHAERTVKQRMSFRPFRWKRYSNRQQREIDFSGIIGELELEGDLAPFMPLLQAGEIIHIGRGTVYGMGKYVIEEIKN